MTPFMQGYGWTLGSINALAVLASVLQALPLLQIQASICLRLLHSWYEHIPAGAPAPCVGPRAAGTGAHPCRPGYPGLRRRCWR